MAKQKMVMKLSMADAKKRSKALKTAVGLPGVISVTLEEDKMVVIGEGVDSISLTTVLRKKMGHVDLVSVGSAEEKKEDKKGESKSEPQPLLWPNHYAVMPTYAYHLPADHNSSCIIM